MSLGLNRQNDKAENAARASAEADEHKEMTVAELKQYIAEWKEDVFEMERRARRVFREHTTAAPTVAAFFHEIYALSFATRSPSGWFWKTQDEWDSEYAFSRSNVATAHKVLEDELGIIETRPGVGNRTYYRLLPARVIEVLYPDKEKPSTTGSECRKPASSLQETSKQVAGIQHSLFIDNNIDRAESGARHDSLQEPPRPADNEGDELQRHGHAEPDRGENMKNSGAAPGGADDDLGRLAVSVSDKLDARLKEEHGDTLYSGQLRDYAKQVRTLRPQLDDLSPEQRRETWNAIIEHIVERWPHYKAMPLEEALDDLLPEYAEKPHTRWRADEYGHICVWRPGDRESLDLSYEGEPDGAEVTTPDGNTFIRENGKWRHTGKMPGMELWQEAAARCLGRDVTYKRTEQENSKLAEYREAMKGDPWAGKR